MITNEEGILNGVTRRNVIRCVQRIMTLELRPIKLQELLDAEEIFITSSTKRIMPIVRLNDQLIANGEVGDQTQKVMTLFKEFRQDYIRQKLSNQGKFVA